MQYEKRAAVMGVSVQQHVKLLITPVLECYSVRDGPDRRSSASEVMSFQFSSEAGDMFCSPMPAGNRLIG
jgi:hypothetical protein